MYASVETGGDNGTADHVRVVDFRSDTISVPTPSMRQAMFTAVVGDDVYGEDPTVRQLEQRSAALFGKEAALFVPSGTMANLLAMMVHCSRRGTEAIVGDIAHGFLYEQGGAAQIAGVLLNTIKNNPDGTFCLNELVRKFRGFDVHEPNTVLVMVENTHNICGGKVLPLDWLEKLAAICREKGAKVHMDGARVFNAASYLNLPVSRIVRDVDSVCFCLSKGLACPVGSICSERRSLSRSMAHRLRKALGGGMRQVGFLAAAGLCALDEIVPKLKDDHARTRRVAEAIDQMGSPIFKVDLANLHTNILMVEILSKQVHSSDFAHRLATVAPGEMEAGVVDADGKGIAVKVSARDWTFARIVIYTNITDEDVELAIKKIRYVVAEYEKEL
uniref:Aromatic amino acid beta-eliminating lyase/threonine aldolase domain-containing protein n=1 Tax=Anopheles coluzzii TaxID=1518534 RepID=A0A8W7PAV1_ANOCL